MTPHINTAGYDGGDGRWPASNSDCARGRFVRHSPARTAGPLAAISAGLAYHNGTLYIAELSQISKIDNVEDHLDNPPKPTVIYTDLPKDEAHGWKFIGIGPDNKLYIPVGQPGNNVLHDKDHGQIRRINLDGTGRETVALGVRNSVGFDWNPVNKQLYFSDNGRDWMSEDVPQDELNRVTKIGEDFGAPYCYQGNLPDPEFGWGHSWSEFTPPSC